MLNKTRQKRVDFISTQPALMDFCDDLRRSLQHSEEALNSNIKLLVGLHKRPPMRFYLPGFKLGIQTEQLVDDNGHVMWGSKKKSLNRIRRALKSCDAILDLSESNRPVYESLLGYKANQCELFFGPHIFPDRAVELDSVSSGKVIFFGTVKKSRRADVLESLNPAKFQILPEGTFGYDLKKHISSCSAILNVHFQDGVYTESPRLLSAYLSGKPFVSEALGRPFEKGIHYVGIDQAVTVDALEYSFHNLSRLVISKYSFIKLLNRAFESVKRD